ncbi:hypothetical protein GCM10023084_60090 [Streptomyces lacrimifluminis]|uniref:Uncharacterized protein n=1 Tax=Streptomyces lacrimifluminis TaxID=1500077 RepID=A0A917P2R4_9ACTN|nr:hypothetical protein GCM10012282_63040 [Streptomyces lacrimifluminis]
MQRRAEEGPRAGFEGIREVPPSSGAGEQATLESWTRRASSPSVHTDPTSPHDRGNHSPQGCAWRRRVKLRRDSDLRLAAPSHQTPVARRAVVGRARRRFTGGGGWLGRSRGK